VSQQTPSTQDPEPHSASLVQDVPFDLEHLPFFPGLAHELPASHVAEPQHTPSTQYVVEQLPPVEHSLPRSATGTQAPEAQ
jgi:hypothetical protein